MGRLGVANPHPPSLLQHFTVCSCAHQVQTLRQGLLDLAGSASGAPATSAAASYSPEQQKLQRYVDTVSRSGFLSPQEYAAACRLVAASHPTLCQLYQSALAAGDLSSLNRGLMSLVKGDAVVSHGRGVSASLGSQSGTGTTGTGTGSEGDDEADGSSGDEEAEAQRSAARAGASSRPGAPTPAANELNDIVANMLEDGVITRGAIPWLLFSHSLHQSCAHPCGVCVCACVRTDKRVWCQHNTVCCAGEADKLRHLIAVEDSVVMAAFEVCTLYQLSGYLPCLVMDWCSLWARAWRVPVQVYEEDDGQDEEELRDTLIRVSRLSPSSSGGRAGAASAPTSGPPASAAAASSSTGAPTPFPGYPSSLLAELLTILRRADVITRGKCRRLLVIGFVYHWRRLCCASLPVRLVVCWAL